MDDELAEALAKREQPKAEQRFSDWSPDHEVMVGIFEQLGHIANILVAANGGKPGKPSQWPRPTSALQLQRQKADRRRHEALVRRLIPPK